MRGAPPESDWVTRHDIRTMSTDQTSPWVTKEGVEVKIGQVWRDLDKRMQGRCVQVVEFGTITFVGKVRVQGYGRITGASGTKRWLSVARMHRHSTGFELVETIECATMARTPNTSADFVATQDGLLDRDVLTIPPER